MVEGGSEFLSSDSASQQDIAVHQGHSLGVGAAEVRIFEKRDYGGFGGFLKAVKGFSVESECFSFEVHSLEHKPH